jgi:hypothetical protein
MILILCVLLGMGRALFLGGDALMDTWIIVTANLPPTSRLDGIPM